MAHTKDSAVSLLLSISFFLAGAIAAFLLGAQVPLAEFNIHPEINLVLLSLVVMIFSALFFGKLTPLFFLLLGANQSSMLKELPLLLAVNAVPLFIMGFVGTLFGKRLLDDLNGSDNIYSHKKELLAWFAMGIVIAFAIGFFNPQLVSLNSQLTAAFK